jgi:hypothetical protein
MMEKPAQGMVSFFVVFVSGGSLCSQADLELEILLPPSSKCWDYRSACTSTPGLHE